MHELCKRLVDHFDVMVFCPHAKGASVNEKLDGVRIIRFRYAPENFETLVNDGGIVSNLKAKPWKWLLLPLFFLSQLFGVWEINRKWKPNLIHAHWIIPQALSVTLLGLVSSKVPPLYITSHGADLFALKSCVFQRLKQFVVGRASGVSVVSSVMKLELEALGCNLEKVTVLPMGVDLEERFIPNQHVERSRRGILFVGRLVEKKGLRYLIEAFPSVLETFHDASITVVGFGPDRINLVELADTLGIRNHVNFVGAVPQVDLAEYYQRAAVFVAPFVMANNGDQEGLGLVLVEALGCGCPVVVSDVPASRDVTREVEGVITIPMRDSPAIAEAIISIFHQNEETNSEVASSLSNLRQRFSWSAVANSYAEQLHKLLKPGG